MKVSLTSTILGVAALRASSKPGNGLERATTCGRSGLVIWSNIVWNRITNVSDGKFPRLDCILTLFAVCTDDFAGWLALQTNLALKGIIGIKAMSELADLLDRTGDADNFRVSGKKYPVGPELTD